MVGAQRSGVQTSPGTGFRLRFALLVTLVAVIPVALATWAVIRLTAHNEVNRADTQLTAIVGVARAQYMSQVSALQLQATTTAAEEHIQRMIVRDRLKAMEDYVALHPYRAFRVNGRPIGGDFKQPVVTATAKVAKPDKNGAYGAVILARPVTGLYRDLVPRNLRSSGEHLVVVVGGTVVAGVVSGRVAAPSGQPGDITVGDTEYRAVSVTLRSKGGQPTITAVALRSRHSIDSASSGTWKWAVGAALVTLATVALLAFLVAPAVAGRRWVRRLLPRELEEQYAVATPVEAPVTSHGAQPTSVANGAPAAGASRRRRIVVIDNDPDERDLFAEVLGPDGIDVAATGDAEQGLGLLGARPADLAILDWKMSGRSGAEILAELNIRHPDVPVLIVADELEPQQRHVATLLGAEDFLIRPLESEAVTAKAMRLLDTEGRARVPG